jgi:hypothetical protein
MALGRQSEPFRPPGLSQSPCGYPYTFNHRNAEVPEQNVLSPGPLGVRGKAALHKALTPALSQREYTYLAFFTPSRLLGAEFFEDSIFRPEKIPV